MAEQQPGMPTVGPGRRPAAPGPTTQPPYLLTRQVFLRLLGVVYLTAFASLWPQLPGLIGAQGLLPAATFLSRARTLLGGDFWTWPTLAWLDSSDAFLQGLCGAGVLCAALLILGLLPGPSLVVLWLCYLSLFNIGQDFLSFQWDALLLEVGFLAIFLAPWAGRLQVPTVAPPSRVVIGLLRWVLFRLMFFSGVVKFASGDPTWHNFTALAYHYWTQPLPTPLAWYLSQLPTAFHQLSTASVLAVELGAPWLIWAPRRLRLVGAGLLIALQGLILLTGNFAFFNLLTITLCVLLLDDHVLRRLVPTRWGWTRQREAPPAGRLPLRWRWLVTGPLAGLILLLSGVQLADQYAPALPIPTPLTTLAGQLAPFRLVSSYGLFAVMTTSHPVIVIEGSADGQTWRAYDFFYQPGDLRRPPLWVAPYHPRLDWQLWFAALDGPSSNTWFTPLLQALLDGNPAVLRLLQTNPFPTAPPRLVRASLYNYTFTRWGEDDPTGAWWRREFVAPYYPPTARADR